MKKSYDLESHLRSVANTAQIVASIFEKYFVLRK